jgi:hypothetical protein
MFALNEGWKWKSSTFANSLHGVVYLAVNNHLERMRRWPRGDFAWQMFDPQLYLCGLDPRISAKACARLASYPWFSVAGVPDFNSGETTQTKWQQVMQAHVKTNWRSRAPADAQISIAARSAMEFQADLGCTHVLTLSPLIDEREDEAATAGQWLDASLEAANELEFGQPVVATVALSENVLNEGAFLEGGFLDTIADQVTSRTGLSGVYIVVAQSQSRHPLSAPSSVTRAYAHLTRAFTRQGYDFVFVNFADVFGLACVALGASGFATGPSQSLRRLSLAAFLDDGGGVAMPHLYSHPAVAEFLPERELAIISELNLIRRVLDQTIYSSDLFRALARGRPVTDVTGWAETKNNIATSANHFIARMIAEGEEYERLDPNERFQRADGWLDNASTIQDSLRTRLAGRLRTEPMYAPVVDWLENLREGRTEADDE